VFAPTEDETRAWVGQAACLQKSSVKVENDTRAQIIGWQRGAPGERRSWPLSGDRL